MVTEALKNTITEAAQVAKMYEDIKRWAKGLLVVGALSAVFFNQLELDPTWGIVLMITGVLSIKVRIPQMFRLYAVLVGGVAVSNLLNSLGTESWVWSIIWVISLLVWTASLARQYKKYRQLPLADLYQAGNWPEELGPPQEESLILRRFTKASLLITLFMFILFSTTCVGLVIYASVLVSQGSRLTETAFWQSTVASLFPYILAGLESMSLFTLALSTAALVPKNPKRDLALVGVIVSSVCLALYYGFLVIQMLVLS